MMTCIAAYLYARVVRRHVHFAHDEPSKFLLLHSFDSMKRIPRVSSHRHVPEFANANAGALSTLLRRNAAREKSGKMKINWRQKRYGGRDDGKGVL